MKKIILSLLLCFSLTASPVPAAKAGQTSDADAMQMIRSKIAGISYEEGSVLVTMLAPDTSPLVHTGEASFDKNIKIEDCYDFGDAGIECTTEREKQFLSDKSIRISSISSDEYSTARLMEKLQNSAYVLSVEPDAIVKKCSTNDPFSNAQWALDGDSLFSASTSGIGYKKTKQYQSSDTPVVAITDTGIDYRHEDLMQNLWVNPFPDKLPGYCGYDFGDNDADPFDDDTSDSHGTHCAGTIGAVANNNIGIAGVASHVKLMGIKIFTSKGICNISSIISALNYIYQAKKLGINVVCVNCSWGGSPSGNALATIVKQLGEAGVLFVAAAGNDGNNEDISKNPKFPYDLNSPYVITVGSSGTEDTVSPFSTYGKTTVDLFAPGERILSTISSYSFLPAMSPQAASNYTLHLDTGKEDTSRLKIPQQIGITASSPASISITRSTRDFFDRPDGSCYRLNLPSLKKNIPQPLYYDITDLNLSKKDTFYISFDIALNQRGQISWQHLERKYTSSNTNDFVSYNNRTYIRLTSLTIGENHDNPELYMDNIALSKPNLPKEILTKYSYESGTSMAAPFVSGALALLANAYPKDTCIERRNRLYQCVRNVPALKNYCKTSGVLDISKIYVTKKTGSLPKTVVNKKVYIKKIKLNKKKAKLKYRKRLKLKAIITPKKATNKNIKWSVSKKKYATVSKKGVVKAKKKGIGHTVRVYAKAVDGSGKKAYCTVKIRKK